MLAKYKANMPVFIVSKFPPVAKQSRTLFGTHGVVCESEMPKVRAQAT
jgi:hypothetical protein